ncbi:MAG: hypothetical protein AB1589_17065 [Cyanobacteriota bacterium]
MLVNTSLVSNTSVDCLVQFWAERYVPDLSILSSTEDDLIVSELVDAASGAGRKKTAIKLRRLLQINCEYAAIMTNMLFSYIPNIVNLTEAKQISQMTLQVYEKAIEIYEQQSIPKVLLEETLQTAASKSLTGGKDFSKDDFTECITSAIKQLARSLEPLLLQLQEQHQLAHDQSLIGFLSTQFHFTAQSLLNRLNLSEQVLLSPYFKFLEEQICIPWQRVCSAAAKYEMDSPVLALVQQMLPVSHKIAQSVYRQAAQLYPTHRSRRGKLAHPGVAASTIRDLEMFQSYLWLCVLEKNIAVVEQELMPLCVMVFPNVDVTWELVRQMLQLLVNEVKAHLQPNQLPLLQPYTRAMQQLFFNLETKVA